MPQRVFLDANKLIQFGHGLVGAEAKTLKELVDAGLVSVVTTDLTTREVAKRFAKQEMEKIQEVCKSEFRDRAKRYLGVDIPETSREDLWQRIFDEQMRIIDAFMRELK